MLPAQGGENAKLHVTLLGTDILDSVTKGRPPKRPQPVGVDDGTPEGAKPSC